MSSYFPSFSYLGQNSQNDFGLIVASVDPDNGEMDSGMSQEQIYTDSYRGTKRLLYGTRYDTTPIIKITVVKCDGQDFSIAEGRRIYRWLTGSPNASWLDLYVGDELQYSFSATIKDVKPYKLDSRTVAFTIYCESLSPWAYSAIQRVGYALEQSISIDNNGVLYKAGGTSAFKIDNNGVVYDNVTLAASNGGVVYINNTSTLTINNLTDDLYTPVYLNTTISNNTIETLSIKNITTNEETHITDLRDNETVTLSNNQFITSNISGRTFGNSFNFVWPRLVPGINEFIIDGSGDCSIEFAYRYPIKVGDCIMNTLDVLEESGCGAQCSVDEPELYAMLQKVLY